MTGDAFKRVISGKGRLFAGLAMAALLAGPAYAQGSYAVDIAAGPLEPALLTLAKQTHEQLFFSKSMVAGRKAPGLHGRYTADQALAVLLAASNITADRAGPGLVVLRASRAAPVAKPPVSEGPAVRPFVTAALDQAVEGAAGPPEARATPVEHEVEAVEVTGSHIRGASTASPLVVLTQTQLERTGYATLADALRTLPANFGGVAAEGNTLTGADGVGRNTAFGTGLNLRGLGNGATLVLINGHRLAGSGTFGDFTDISTIPTAAVERVEVLLDGASAAYGSDAVGGVVNVIMRRNFEGAEARVFAGVGTAGEPAQGQVSLTFGKRWTGGGVLLAYELQRREALQDGDRRYSASADLRPFGGSDFRVTNGFPGNILKTDPVTNALVPGYAIPAGQNGVGLRPSDLQPGVVNLFNQREREDLLPRQTLNSLYLAADQEVGSRLELSADARYAYRRYKAHQISSVSTLTVSRANPFYVAPTGAASERIAYSFIGDLPNPVSAGSAEVAGATLEATLRLAGDWRAEAYGTFAQEIDEVRGSHFVNSLFFNEALGTTADNPATAFSTGRDGFFNPFSGTPGSNTGAVTAFIGSARTWVRSRDRVSSLNLETEGTLWTLPGGALKLALGAQARHESLYRNGANWLFTVAPVPLATVTDESRDVTAAFAEARVPLFGPDNARPGLERLELSLAGRVEHYETIGNTANPSVGLLWAPSQNVQLRGTYSRSFRAPALREVYDPAGNSPTILLQGAARVQVLQLGGGNPTLKPETATSWTGGVDFKPARWPGLTLSVTGFDVRFHDRIDTPALVNFTNALTDPSLAPFVQRISPATNAADLALITQALASAPLSGGSDILPTQYGAIVDTRYVNTTTLHVSGVDVTGGYDFDLGEDRVSLAANASYLFRYDQQLTPTSAVVKRVNVANFPLRFRSRLTADWTRGRLSLGGALNYVGAYHDSLGAGIGDQATVDLQARLSPAETGVMKGLRVLLNVRNVFDDAPPFYNNARGFAYDPANADPIGRFVSIQLTRAW
jgi:outer membrane receptor protein involved in Fe transport